MCTEKRIPLEFLGKISRFEILENSGIIKLKHNIFFLLDQQNYYVYIFDIYSIQYGGIFLKYIQEGCYTYRHRVVTAGVY